MKPFRIFPLVVLLSCLIFSSNASAYIDANAPVVSVRVDCTENNGTVTLNNCFTSMSDLTNWLWNARMPNAASPLVVNIGPGTFDQLGNLRAHGLICNPTSNYTGYISFVGSGRQQTIIAAANGFGIYVSSCTDLSFSNLGVLANGGSGGGISWNGGGESTWNDVDVNAQYYGWREQTCGSSQGTHSWFGSRILATDVFTSARGYSASCDASWFYGSEISINANSGSDNGVVALEVTGQGEAHVYGSVIRAITSQGTISGTVVNAVSATNGAMVHIHGTGIDVISTVPNNLVALSASGGAMIHAPGAAYNMSTAGGTVTRIVNNGGNVMAPYLWEPNTTPPGIVNVAADGADMAVQTNCASSGCQTTGTETHLLVYNSNCTGSGGHWFDVVTHSCR